MNFYHDIVRSLYVYNTKIGDTWLDPFEFIEAKQRECPYGAKVFYKNIMKEMPNHFGAKIRNDFFKEVLQYCKQKIDSLLESETNTPHQNETKTLINIFCKSMVLSIPKEHFKVFTENKSKNGNPFLTVEQLNLFIDRAFYGKCEFQKSKFNQTPRGEKLLIQNVFYDFYNAYCFEYFNTMQCQDIFIKLLTENFEGWDFNNVKANFTPKTKKRI